MSAGTVRELGKHLLDAVAGFVGDPFTQRHPANRFMLHGVRYAPADIAIPDIARVLFWPGFVRVETRYHCLNQVCFYGQIKLVEQIVLGGKVAKQRTSANPGAAGDGGG